jgi:hypothetical protein
MSWKKHRVKTGGIDLTETDLVVGIINGTKACTKYMLPDYVNSD